VDDGVATGATMKAAVATLKREGLAKLVVAVLKKAKGES
jgi:predicted phosphoribosyltransferase